jgi:phosphoglycolate phosphatase-like HAD superfamily hydrolase
MLLRAIDDLHLDASVSLLVGDQESDIQAGRRAGLRAVARFSPEGATETAADVVLNDHRQTLAWIHQMSAGRG